MALRFSLFELIRRKMKEYRRISEIDEIARRYLAMNTFDGVLGMLGILSASFFAGVSDPKTAVIACIGSSIAIGMSGFYGAYMTEMAERKGKIRKLESAMSLHLQDTHIGRAHRYAAVILGLINGLSSSITSLFIVVPFLAGVAVPLAYYISITLAFAMLFVIGMYLGSISRENIMFSGVKLLAVGTVCALVLLLLEMPKPL